MPLILNLIRELAEFKKEQKEVVATEASLTQSLLGKNTYAEVIISVLENMPIRFAPYYYSFLTFLSIPGNPS